MTRQQLQPLWGPWIQAHDVRPGKDLLLLLLRLWLLLLAWESLLLFLCDTL